MINNPLFFIYSCVRKRMDHNEPLKWFCVAIPFISLLFFRAISDICPCTLFNIACFLQVFLVVTMTGRFATSSIAGEREKKTLDSLRLTAIGAKGIITGKILPDLLELSKIILVTSPFLLLLGWSFSGTSFITPFFAIAISIYSGLTMICGLVLLSAFASGLSSAIFLSWVLRFVWLFITPLLDTLLAAIMARSVTIPFISNLNPFIPLLTLLMPGSLGHGLWSYTLYIYPFIVPAFCLLSIYISASLIEKGEKTSHNGRSNKIDFSETFLGRSSDFISVFKNPIFLKEIVSYRKDLAGFMPGVLVFAILILAPYFYCVSSGVKVFNFTGSYNNRVTDIKPVNNFRYIEENQDLPVSNPYGKLNSIVVRNINGEDFFLPGHKEHLCLRVILYETIALPLPYRVRVTTAFHDEPCEEQTFNQVLQGGTSNSSIYAPITYEKVQTPVRSYALPSENRDVLYAGFYLGVFLLLIYLLLRSSSFLCATYNTEKNKLTWDLLMLTQLKPSDIISGKLWGALFMPLLQMSIGFLSLSFWIYKGVITFSGAMGFYIFCISIALCAGLLGQYNSITSPSAHVSQGKTVARVIIFSIILPVLYYFFFIISLCLFGIRQGQITGFIWTPFLIHSQSGLTLAPVSFILTMALLFMAGYRLWNGISGRLKEELNI